MKLKNKILTASAIAGLTMTGSVFASVGGGATIHNVATLSFSGGSTVASVDVEVSTIATQPTITVGTPDTVDGGEAGTVTYYIMSNSNGLDTYNLTASLSDDAGTTITAASGVSVTPPSPTLAASIIIGTVAGGIEVPAGSEIGFGGGELISINGFWYTYVGTIVGSPEATVGGVTTPESPSVIQVTPVLTGPNTGGPVITLATALAGIQVGEVASFDVDFTAGNPTTAAPGSHTISIGGATSSVDDGPAGGSVVTIVYTDSSPSVTVLSGDADLVKEVQNDDDVAPVFTALAGTTGQTGDTLTYRITASSKPTLALSGAVLTDSIPDYTSYVPGSTVVVTGHASILGAVADDAGPNLFPLLVINGGIDLRSATGAAAGDVVDGEDVVVTFQVTID